MRRFFEILMFMFTMVATQIVSAQNATPAVLVTGRTSISGDIDTGLRFLIDPAYEKKLTADGYRVASQGIHELTPDTLRLFNTVVLVQEPKIHSDRPEQAAAVNAQYDMLLSYVHNGGGLMLFFDELRYSEEWKYSLNILLSKLDAQVGREAIVDSDESRNHIFSLLSPPGEYRALRTEAITDHPATRGVQSFWYPRITGTFKKLGPDWTLLMRGSNTASTAKTWRNNPPLLAVRGYGKGRVAVFLGHSSYYVNNGYHLAYENGFCFEQGDGYKLFDQLFQWLGEPSTHLNGFGGYHTGMLPPLPSPGGVMIKRFRNLENLPAHGGIVGVYSKYSGGLYSVADFAARARSLGLKFIAFTDRITTAEAWEAHKRDCLAASDKDFVAIPGVEFTARKPIWNNGRYERGPGDVGFAINIDRWPPAEGFNDWMLFLMNLLNASVDHTGIFAVAQPDRNGTPAVNLGGFNAVEVASFEGLRQTGSGMATLDMLQPIPGASPTPIVSHRIWSPDQLDAVARDGFRFYLYAPDVASLRKWAASDLVPGFVSNGPVIQRFWADNMFGDPWERYLLWNPGDLATVHLSVSSESPLTRVQVLSGNTIVRTLAPNARNLNTSVSFPLVQEGPISVRAYDERGRMALSYAIPTRNLNYWNHVGSDRMNDYHNPILPDEDGQIVYNGQRFGHGGLVTFGYGWGDLCRFYFPVADAKYHPQGYETGTINAGIARINTFPILSANQTDELSSPAIERGMPLATRDVAIVTEKFNKVWRANRITPTQFIEGESSSTIFRYTYKDPGTIVMLVNTRATVTQQVDIKGGPALGLKMLEVPMQARNQLAEVVYQDERGNLIRVPYDPTGVSLRLAKGAFVTLTPEKFGLSAVYAVDDDLDVVVSGTTPSIAVGYKLHGQTLLRGREFKTRLLVCQEGAGLGVDHWIKLGRAWGLTPGATPAAVATTSGQFVQTRYITEFAAHDGGVTATIPAPAYMANDLLPVTVKNLNARATAGIFDGQHFYPGAYNQGELYLGLEAQWFGRPVFLGTPIMCDNASIRVEILSLDDKGATVQLCNLVSEKQQARVSVAAAMPVTADALSIKLKPYECKSFKVAFKPKER